MAMDIQNQSFIKLKNIPSEEKDQDLDVAAYKINTYGTDFTTADPIVDAPTTMTRIDRSSSI
jgi:hypothetical protein